MPPAGQWVLRIVLHARDVGGHRFVDAGAQLFHQLMAGAKNLIHRLCAAAEGLVEKFALVPMQRIEIGVQIPIEALHIGVAFRRSELEHLHEAFVVVQPFFPRIAGPAEGKPPHRQRMLVVGIDRHRAFRRREALPRVSCTKEGFGEIDPGVRVFGLQPDRCFVRRDCLLEPAKTGKGKAHAIQRRDMPRQQARSALEMLVRFREATHVEEEIRLLELQLPHIRVKHGDIIVGTEKFLVPSQAEQQMVELAMRSLIQRIAGNRRPIRIHGSIQFAQVL